MQILFIIFAIAIAVVLAIFVHLWPIFRLQSWARGALKALASRDYEMARKFYQKIYDTLPRLQETTLRSATEFLALQGLGTCFAQRDDFVEAESYLLRAVEMLDTGVEQSPGVVANLLANLAIVQFAQQKTAESDQTMKRLRENCNVAEDRDLNDVVELVTGAAAGAAFRNFKELAFQIAGIAENALRHTDAWQCGMLAHVKISLASYHMLYCEYGPAQELIEAALNEAGDELELKDKENAWFQLGNISCLTGDFQKARHAFEQSLLLRIEEHGADHWVTSITIASLANAHRGFGDYSSAMEVLDEAWRIQSSQLQPDDRILIATSVMRSVLLTDLGRFSEADSLLHETAKVLHNDRNSKHMAFLRLVQGISAHECFRYDAAETLLRDALAIGQKMYGIDDRTTCDFQDVLSANLTKQGRYDEAESMVLKCISIRESKPDVSTIDLAGAYRVLADLYVATKRWERAAAAAQHSFELIDKRVGPTKLMRAEIDETFGRISLGCGDFLNAKSHFENALRIRDSVQPPNHPSLVSLLEAYADGLEGAGELNQAIAQRTRAEQIRIQYR